jgi:dihydroorotate dehydrogenase (NAD+) catalytic subunit
MMPSLSTHIGNLTLAHPVMNASGAFNAVLAQRLHGLEGVMGALVSKTVTPLASSGNPQQRTVELPGVGMLNSIGLQGKGIITTMNTDVPQWYEGAGNTPIILSISADSELAFARMAGYIEAHPQRNCLNAIEVNVSCPNVHAGGALFGSSPEWVARAVRAVHPTPLMLWQ